MRTFKVQGQKAARFWTLYGTVPLQAQRVFYFSQDDLTEPVPVRDNANAAIVLLEDDALVRCAVVTVLEARGFEVAAGSTGAEVAGLVAKRRLQPMLIVADYRLGLKTAVDEVPEILAALPRAATVVVTTGDTSAETRTLTM